MSKVKLLINEVFKKGEQESGKNKKNGIALFLSVCLKDNLKISIDERTLVRYYDAYVIGNDEISIEPYKLDKLSQYIGYKNFADFSNTIVKRNEEANFTEVKINVDGNEIPSPHNSPNVTISITNVIESKVNDVKDFITKNGIGILEMTFLLLLVTGGVVFSKGKGREPAFGISSLWGVPAIEKPYMYWDKDRYMATDSASLHSRAKVIPMNDFAFINLQKITRPDTLTIENAMGKVWYDKSDNHVEFFTSFGKHPENEKALKDVSEHILETYGGANAAEELADN